MTRIELESYNQKGGLCPLPVLSKSFLSNQAIFIFLHSSRIFVLINDIHYIDFFFSFLIVHVDIWLPVTYDEVFDTFT